MLIKKMFIMNNSAPWPSNRRADTTFMAKGTMREWLLKFISIRKKWS